MLTYLGLKFYFNPNSGRHNNTGQQRLYEFCYLLPFDLWTSYLARILFLKEVAACFGNILILQGSLMSCNIVFQVWQGFINVSKSFSYKDSIFILATIRKEDFRINSSFKSDFLVYLGLLKGDKSDSSIFRMIIFLFFLFFIIIFFLVFGSIVSGLHISPPKGGPLGFI
jgi:hypothetical protein